jgi:hypothetical protein
MIHNSITRRGLITGKRSQILHTLSMSNEWLVFDRVYRPTRVFIYLASTSQVAHTYITVSE